MNCSLLPITSSPKSKKTINITQFTSQIFLWDVTLNINCFTSTHSDVRVFKCKTCNNTQQLKISIKTGTISVNRETPKRREVGSRSQETLLVQCSKSN